MNDTVIPSSSLREAWSYSALHRAAVVLKGDTVLDEPVLEIDVDGSWVLAQRELFSSWTGLRRINGEDHHGPVVYLGGGDYRGRRVCQCSTCQSTVDPVHRHN